MSKVKIKVVVDTADTDQVEALASFLRAVGGHSTEGPKKIKETPVHDAEIVEAKEKGPGAKATKGIPVDEWTDEYMKDHKTADELKDACAELNIDYDSEGSMNTNAKLRRLILQHFKEIAKNTPLTQKPPEKTPAAAENSGGPTIDDVRKLVQENAGAHRDAMKAKLEELGAKNVTTLDPSKFQEFIDYVKGL